MPAVTLYYWLNFNSSIHFKVIFGTPLLTFHLHFWTGDKQPLIMATPTATVDAQAAQCSICLDNIEDRTTVSNCRHVFCYDCISHWLLQHNRCPLCRSVITQVAHQVIEAGSVLPVERTEDVPVPESQMGYVFNMGFLTLVHTPLESQLFMLIPVKLSASERFFYMLRSLEPDHDFIFANVNPGTLFVLPQDLENVKEVLESHNIFRVEPGIHTHAHYRHADFLEVHEPHQYGHQAQVSSRQSTSTANSDEDELD